VFILLQWLQVVIAPIPDAVLGFAAGYLFGPLWGTVYSLVGGTIGSIVVFTLSRTDSRPYVERVLHAGTIERFGGFIERRGAVALFLVPGLPDDVVSLLAGPTRISLPRLVVISVVGRLPGFLLVAVAGSSFATDQPLLGFAILLPFAVAGVLASVYNDRLLGA
jgi:uncharacterized membrane protein YdjX (TVP38/TMEM64 family)